MSETLRYNALPHSGLSKEANLRYWNQLKEFFVGQPGFIPPIELGTASVAVNEKDEIVGAGILQMVSYLGPVKIREDYRTEVDFSMMKRILDGTFSRDKRGSLIIQGYIAMTADERMAKLGEFVGMKRIHPIVLIQNFLDKDQIPL